VGVVGLLIQIGQPVLHQSVARVLGGLAAFHRPADAGGAGDVTGVLRATQGTPFGVGEPVVSQVADHGGFGSGANVAGSAGRHHSAPVSAGGANSASRRTLFSALLASSSLSITLAASSFVSSLADVMTRPMSRETMSSRSARSSMPTSPNRAMSRARCAGVYGCGPSDGSGGGSARRA